MSSQEGTGGGDGGGGGEGERGGGAGVPPIKAAITPPNCLLAITGANKFARRLRRKSAESKQKAVKASAGGKCPGPVVQLSGGRPLFRWGVHFG